MANNVQESLSDISSQKSVTDWLMHVISGKMPGDTEDPELLHEEARPGADLPKVNGAHSETNGSNGAAAAGELPSQNGFAATKANGAIRLEEVRAFTADDLCGPPAFGPVPTKEEPVATRKEEITANDLCWVPSRQEFETPPNWMVNAALSAEVAQIETPLDAVPLAMPDLERELPAYEAAETVEDWEPRKYVISTADILRERAPALVQQFPSGAAAGERSMWEAQPVADAVIAKLVDVPAVEPERAVTAAEILPEAPFVVESVVAAEPQPVVDAVVAKAVDVPTIEPERAVMAAGILPEAPPVVESVMAAEPQPVVDAVIANAIDVPAVEPERAVTAAEIFPAAPQVVEPVMAAEPQLSGAADGAVSAGVAAEPAAVELAANPVPAEVMMPAEARPELVSSAPAEQSVVAAITREGREPLGVAAAETAAPALSATPIAPTAQAAPVAQVQAVGEVLSRPEIIPSNPEIKEQTAASTALVAESKGPNGVAVSGEQVARQPRAKRNARAKREHVVTIADICRDWVLEEMLDKASGAEELDEEDLDDELQGLIEGNAAAPAESVFAHEGIWGNPVRPEPAAPEGQGEGAYSEQPSGLMAAEGLTEVEETRSGVQSSGVKALLKLGSMLPWLARDFPVVESVNKPQNNALTQEVRDEVAGMRLVQHEIRSTVHDHSLQLKRVEEQLSRVRETLVEESSETADLVDSVKTTNRAVAMFGVGMCLLLVVMLAMLVVLVMHGR